MYYLQLDFSLSCILVSLIFNVMEIMHTSSYRKSASLSLFFFQTEISTWHYLPGKWQNGKIQVAGLRFWRQHHTNMPLPMFEWYGNDAPACHRWTPSTQKLLMLLGYNWNWAHSASSPTEECSDRPTSPLHLPLPPQTKDEVFLKGRVRQEMACPSLAWAGLNSGTTQL